MILTKLCQTGFENVKPKTMGIGEKILERIFENNTIIWSITQTLNTELYGICITTKNLLGNSQNIKVSSVVNQLVQSFRATSKCREINGKVVENLSTLNQGDINLLLRSLGNDKPCNNGTSRENKDDEYLDKTEIDNLLDSIDYLDQITEDDEELNEDDHTDLKDPKDILTEEEIVDMMSFKPDELGLTIEFYYFNENSLLNAISNKNIEQINQSILKLLALAENRKQKS